MEIMVSTVRPIGSWLQIVGIGALGLLHWNGIGVGLGLNALKNPDSAEYLIGAIEISQLQQPWSAPAYSSRWVRAYAAVFVRRAQA